MATKFKHFSLSSAAGTTMVRPRKRSAVSPTKEDDSAIEVNQNFISKLPDDILHDILSRVPLDAAARTMVLSKRWLTVFPTKPDLDMSNFSLGLYMRLDDSELAARLGQLSRSRKLESYLNGKMDTFVMSIVKQRVDADLTRFSFSGCLSSKGFNACVHKLVSMNVPDIDLVLILYSPLSLPDRFYSHRSIRHLKLQSVCPVRRPHLVTEGPNLLLLSLSKVLVAETFHSLKSLWLDGVYFMDSHLLTCFFVSENFPRLTLLFLHNCFGLEGANTAPKPLVIQCKTLTEVHLNWLHFGAITVHGENITIFNSQWCLGHGNSPSILTLNTPRLEHFYWSGYGCPIEIIAPKPSLKATFRADINLSTIPSNMDSAMSFLEAFTNMTRISLGPQTIEVLGILKLQRNPRFQFIKFNKVSSANITIVPHKMGTVGLGSFLAMCPNLSSITLNVDPEYSIMSNFLDYFEENLDEATFWRDDELLPELQHFLVSIRELEVNLTRFDLAKESILAFLDFVMEHATNLERVKYIRHNKSFTYTPVRSG